MSAWESGGEHGLELARMVAVVVDQHDLATAAQRQGRQLVEAASHAGEGLQRARDGIGRHAQLPADRSGSQRVRIVASPS